MDRPRQNDHLGVKKNIRKSPLHQPTCAAHANLAAAAVRPQGQPQVYNINRNDFRSIVQQLTGSPSRESLPRPPQNNSTKPQSTRLQRIRPPPLTQINQPAMAPLRHHPHCLMRPPPQVYLPQGIQQPMMGQGDQFWSNTAESPISECMRYLHSGNQMQPGHEHRPYMPAQLHSQPQPYIPAQPQPYLPVQSQPHPHMMHESQPQMNMQGTLQPSRYLPPSGLVSSPVPQFNGPVPVTPTIPSPRFSQMYGDLPSPQYNAFGFGQMHSPTSQFAPPSPTAHSNMFSPISPYPLLSPGVQYPQPLTPNFSFSQLAQSGGPGPGAGPPSPGLFPVPSPRWGDY